MNKKFITNYKGFDIFAEDNSEAAYCCITEKQFEDGSIIKLESYPKINKYSYLDEAVQKIKNDIDHIIDKLTKNIDGFGITYTYLGNIPLYEEHIQLMCKTLPILNNCHLSMIKQTRWSEGYDFEDGLTKQSSTNKKDTYVQSYKLTFMYKESEIWLEVTRTSQNGIYPKDPVDYVEENNIYFTIRVMSSPYEDVNKFEEIADEIAKIFRCYSIKEWAKNTLKGE